MEQALGHMTHHQNLQRWVEEAPDIQPTWMPVPPHATDCWERLPVVRHNWSLRGSLRAREALRAAGRMDALFVHTQTLSLFAIPFLRRVPSVLSLDATPLNYDTVGAHYGHVAAEDGFVERRKRAWNRSTFHAATALVTWCRWAKESLVSDYGVPAERVTVIPPGVELERWRPDEAIATGIARQEDPVRLLFVGGDFRRKGGATLAAAFGALPPCGYTLDLVTRDEQAARDLRGVQGARVHTDLTPNSPRLRELYARADLFVFPTEGDCLPIAVMEAMASGLPVITTGVGALREEVEEGVNGLIIPPGDVAALRAAIETLARDPVRRTGMRAASLQLASERFDARCNYNRLLDLMRGLSESQRWKLRCR
jgi:glycosyltransferase involved in cell wall biosynthesis